MSVIVYADFTCPECYLAARRTDLLAAAGVEVDFRAVEHEPLLPVPGRPMSSADARILTERFSHLQDLLMPSEVLPWAMPAVIPKSEAAVSAYAEIHGTPVDAEVRRLLFDLYWREGANIGDPNLLRTPLTGQVLRADSAADPLRQAGYVVGIGRMPITTDAYRRVRAWRAEWAALGTPALPAVLVGGATLHGVEALRRLDKELSYTGADLAPRLPEPRRYPHVDVRPPASWLSQIGGRWRNQYRAGGIA